MMFKKFRKDRRGATAIEYGLIAGLIAVVCIGAISSVGNTTTVQLTTIAAELN